VETKTAKRKLASKVVARATHEAAAERKKDAVAAATPKKAATPKRAPAAAQLAAKASPGSAKPSPRVTRSKTPAKGAAPAAPGSGGKKGKAAPKGKATKGGKAAKAEEEDDEEEEGEEGEGLGSRRLVVKLDAANQKSLTEGLAAIPAPKTQGPEAAPAAAKKSAVVYLGRIPFGFFEDQMRSYFTQFGEVARLRVSRNKKTGKSKHYAFVEFVVPEVAAIVASTHDNMLMCDRAIKCSVVDADKVHPTMFNGADEKFIPHPWKKMAKEAANGKRDDHQEKTRVRGLVAKERKKRKALEEAGIELDFPGYEGSYSANKPKRTKLE